MTCGHELADELRFASGISYVDSTDLIHGLHPSTKTHASQHSTRALTTEQLPPRVCIHVFTVENILDDVVLRDDCWRFRSRTVAFQCCDDFERFFVLAFADQETGRIGQEGAHGVNAEGEKELKCEGEAPGNVARREGKAEGKPVGDAEARDAVGCWMCQLCIKQRNIRSYPSG